MSLPGSTPAQCARQARRSSKSSVMQTSVSGRGWRAAATLEAAVRVEAEAEAEAGSPAVAPPPAPALLPLVVMVEQGPAPRVCV